MDPWYWLVNPAMLRNLLLPTKRLRMASSHRRRLGENTLLGSPTGTFTLVRLRTAESHKQRHWYLNRFRLGQSGFLPTKSPQWWCLFLSHYLQILVSLILGYSRGKQIFKMFLPRNCGFFLKLKCMKNKRTSQSTNSGCSHDLFEIQFNIIAQSL